MKYKALLLDIDHTLYDYTIAHKKALDAVFDYCQNKFNKSLDELENAFAISRKRVHIELSETGASHNRLLYFQKMLEVLEVNVLSNALNLYNCYWDTFLDNMTVFEGAQELLKKYTDRICFVTDLTAHIQHRKIQKLGFDNLGAQIVTSEEAGKEKPHPYMFMLALQKLNLSPSDVCMIGDSFPKDIEGAANLGIDTVWINHKGIDAPKNLSNNTVITKFNELTKLL